MAFHFLLKGDRLEGSVGQSLRASSTSGPDLLFVLRIFEAPIVSRSRKGSVRTPGRELTVPHT
jgi:hypothetical protein